MSYAYRCEVCGDPPLWRIERRGDAVVSWACMDAWHLVTVLDRLRRWWSGEVAELVVTIPR